MIETANILVNNDGTVRSIDFNDIYFMPNKGVDESTYVFIVGNNIRNRTNYKLTILETGFGTGLNFLITLYEFKDNLSNLHFISIEKFPIIKKDLHKIYAFLPNYLKLYADEVLKNYPKLSAGIHNINIMGATLTLHLNDIDDAINNINTTIDAVYLDGFSPNKNTDMWQQQVFDKLFELSNPKTTIATFSASSFVRKGLENSGFFTNKRKGFGNKSECLIASSRLFSCPTDIKTVAIVGAGVMGSSLAYILSNNGYSVNLYDKLNKPMSGTSGNIYALLDPRFVNEDGGEKLFNKNSYLYALDHYKQIDCWATRGIVKYASKSTPLSRLLSWLDNQQIDHKHMHKISKKDAYSLTNLTIEEECLYLPSGGAINTQKLSEKLSNNCTFIGGNKVNIDTLNEDIVFVCGGAETNEIVKSNLPYTITRGAIATMKKRHNSPDVAISHNGYTISNKLTLIGSHFNRVSSIGNLNSNKNDANNIINKMKPIFSNINIDDLDIKIGYRANTKYHMPSIVQINNKSFAIVGMGSRGFLTAPYTANILLESILKGKNSIDKSIVNMLAKI